MENKKNNQMRLTFPNINGSGELHVKIVKTICGDTSDKSMLDLMSCTAPMTSQLGFKKRTYVDILPRVLDAESEREFFVQYNALDYLNDKGGYYDVIISADGIEHLTKKNGYELLLQTTLFSDKQIFFTPLGSWMVDDSLDPEGHHSGWQPEDFEQLGWATLVFPHWHPLLGIGAFYGFRTDNTEQEFERVKNELHDL